MFGGNRIRGLLPRVVGSDGASLMAKGPTAAASVDVASVDVASEFGKALQGRCEALEISREKFYAMAQAKFRKANPITFERWYKGIKLPQRRARAWFADEFGIVVPDTRSGKVKVANPKQATSSTDLMEYAVGSLQTAIKSTDDQIVHDVKDSLKDPVQSPWVRIAITLIRNAHRR